MMFEVEHFFQYAIESSVRPTHTVEVATWVEAQAEAQRHIAWANGRQADGAMIVRIESVVRKADSAKIVSIRTECEYEDGDQPGWFLPLNSKMVTFND